MIGTPESQADIADRRKVWDAWSELYLDTEITSKWEDGIAGLLANLPTDETRWRSSYGPRCTPPAS